jgi:hypothetical protein
VFAEDAEGPGDDVRHFRYVQCCFSVGAERWLMVRSTPY